MPDVDRTGREPSGKRQFISEKIVKPPLSPRQIARRAVVLMGAAAIFGVVAAVTFVISRPYAERYLGVRQDESNATVSYSKDELDTVAALPSSSEAESSAEETEPIEDLLQSAIENYQFTMDDLRTLNAGIQEVCQEAGRGIVTVHSVKRQVDWFDNPVENTGLYAGAIVAITKDELLILTPIAAVESADSIKVTFTEGSEAAGHIKQTDTVADLAVVSIAVADVDEDVLDNIVKLELGNSYALKQGDMLAAIGSPAGLVHSTSVGRVTYIRKGVQVSDGVTRLIYTDMSGIASAGTFLIDMNGSIVGWVTDEFQNSENTLPAIAMGISDYKGMLEKMSNGIAVPYMGIMGMEITDDMIERSEQEGNPVMPAGVYVSRVVQDGPAYNAGIQNGDIVTGIAGRKITSMRDYQAQLEKLTVGSTVLIEIRRNGRDEYKEIEYDVTVGAR